MKKIAIIGANDFQNPLILKAKELGYETHVFAWKDGSIGEKTADYFYPISIIEKEQILDKCKEIGIDGITTIASDLATVTVNYVAKEMNLAGNTIECNKKSTNKYEMRKAFKDNGVPTLKFRKVTSTDQIDSLIDMKLPLIVKPTDRSGSRAVTKITNKKQLKGAIKRAIENSFEKAAIVEEFIEGKEYSAEGITFDGEHKFLTITQKATTGSPNFIEIGHYEPAGISEETKERVYSELKKALTALEITNSATHSEFKIDDEGNIKIIEIGARMGGDCIGSDLVKISTGYDYLKMVIDVAMGIKPTFEKTSTPKISAIKFILNSKDYADYKKIKETMPNIIYRESKIEKVGSRKVVDSSTRFGFYILSVDKIDDIKWLFKDNDEQSLVKKNKIENIKNLFLLQIIIFAYSLATVTAKFAAGESFLSFKFILLYGIEIAILGIYALLWQQIIKKFEISIAYANRAMALLWSLIWAVLFFNEGISFKNILGVIIVMIGTIIVNKDE